MLSNFGNSVLLNKNGLVFVVEIPVKKNDEEMKDEFEEAFINESELLAEWDNEDPKICDDDMVSDIKN